MTNDFWVPDISRIDGPRYLAVAAAIARAIDSGELPPGAQLPPQRDLADRLGVTVGTVSRAYALAKKRRLIAGEVGRGTFVQGVAGNDRSDSKIPVQAEGAIDLACFRSPVETLDRDIFRLIAEVSDRASPLKLNRYSPGAGSRSNRLAGSSWIGRTGFDVDADRIIITPGAQLAIVVCLATLMCPGDTVLTEELTYSGVKAMARLHGINLRGVAMDREGMVPEALEEMVARTHARIVYLQPSIHNPTTALMPEARRQHIAEIAKRHDLLIIEDDAAASALTERPLPISALAPDRSCYITSLSKSVSPTLRIAYLVAGPRLIGALTDTLHTMALTSSPITAEIAALLIASGTAAEIANVYVQQMRPRLDQAREALPGFDLRGQDGAFYFWLPLPDRWSGDEVTAAARQAGISVATPDSFTVERVAMQPGLRVSLNPSSRPDVFGRGLTILRNLLESRPPARQTVI